MAAPPHPPVNWRFALCDLAGRTISLLSGSASDIQLQYRLNRPAMLSFSVPSDDPLVNILHTDGAPYLSCGSRLVKGFRKVSTGESESGGGWVLRYVGRTWQLEDQGDESTVRTAVTCFDMLKHLEKRVCRASDGNFQKQVQFWSTAGSTIIRQLVERTQLFAGSVRIDTAGGTWLSTASQSVTYDQAYVLPSIITLCDTGTVDLDVTYLNATNGVHMRLGAKPRLGADKPGVIFGYAAPPRTATRFTRTVSMDSIANDITLWGKSAESTPVNAVDAASKTKYDVFEDVGVLADLPSVRVGDPADLVTLLITTAIALRRNPRDLVTVIPAPEISSLPWDEWFLGDTVRVNAARSPNPVTREIVSGVQRVYGYTVSVDDDYGERISDMIVSPQAE